MQFTSKGHRLKARMLRRLAVLPSGRVEAAQVVVFSKWKSVAVRK